MDQIQIDGSQFQKLLSAVNSIADHAPFWKPAVPIFVASLFGLGSALFLDWLKTRRESRKTTRERLEKELAQLSGANTAIAFNIETLTHLVRQHILPHFEQSNAAVKEIQNIQKNNGAQLENSIISCVLSLSR